MAKKRKKQKQCFSGIGGQAVLEGIMMKNKEKYSVAVRKPDGEIVVETGIYDGFLKGSPIKKIPFIRGVFGFLESLSLGMKALNISTEYYIEEEPKKKSPKEKVKDKKKAIEKAQKQGAAASDKSDDLMMGITLVISMAIAIGLFMILPYFISAYFGKYIRNESIVALIEGGIRIFIFIAYIVSISLMKDIRRLYQYHGAEHKCINCLENGKALNVENVMSSSRQHKRCGTSFLLYVVAVSVVIFFFIRVDNLALRLLLRVAMVPVIAGISYEIIRLAGRSNFFLVNILSAPGLMLQKLTTREPDEQMVEVAIKAVEAVYDWKAFLEENYPEALNGLGEKADLPDTEANEQTDESLESVDEQTAKEAISYESTEVNTDGGSAPSEKLDIAAATQQTEENNAASEEIQYSFDGTYADLLRSAREELATIGIVEAENDARLLLEAACGTDRNTLLMTPDRKVSQEELNLFGQYISQRMAHRPVQYILGKAPFMGHEFRVDERVLIPRFDTEVLVEAAMKHIHDGMLILDMCTGSGCILLSLLKYSNDCNGIGTDISADAIDLAMVNAESLGLSEKVHFLQGDMWHAFDELKNNESVAELKFDILLSNPPYIRTDVIDTLDSEVKDFEPRRALDGDTDGLKYYRELLSGAPEFLKHGASLLFEIGYDQAEEVSALMEEYGYKEISIIKDLGGRDRVAYCEFW